MFEIGDYQALIDAIIVFILAIIAWYQRTMNKSNEQIAKTNTVMADVESISVPQVLKAGMLESTRSWILAGENDEDKKKIKEQIDKAQEMGLKNFQIVYSRGGYTIENNMIKSSWRS